MTTPVEQTPNEATSKKRFRQILNVLLLVFFALLLIGLLVEVRELKFAVKTPEVIVTDGPLKLRSIDKFQMEHIKCIADYFPTDLASYEMRNNACMKLALSLMGTEGTQ